MLVQTDGTVTKEKLLEVRMLHQKKNSSQTQTAVFIQANSGI